ncbi:MAG: thioesterase family protein [Pseudomonadota bacterium]
MSERPLPPGRVDFPVFREITTRWADNDMYGHVNNATYYSFMDTVVTTHLLDEGFLTPARSAVIGLTVASSCTYFALLAYPDAVTGGLRAGRIGGSSVTYEVALFRGDADMAASLGSFTHVYVDAATRKPIALPAALRAIAEALAV